LAKLDGVTQRLPDLDFFIFMYVRKEAAFSSNIEGTKATMVDSIKAEAEIIEGLPDDVDTIQASYKTINKFIEIGILEQRDENKTYGRTYVYKDYLKIFTDE